MTPYVAVDRDGLVILLPTAIDAELFLASGRRSDLVVVERACSVLRSAGRLAGGETIVDVGAHIGTTTISALQHHGFAQAIAIEPDPRHLPLLRANVALNGVHDRVLVIAAGLSDRRRRQSFRQGTRKEGAYRWMKGRLVEEPSPGAIAVDTVTLDSLAEEGVADPSATGMLWFDCGSCEEYALDSASAFLGRRVPIVSTLRRRQTAEPTPLLAHVRANYEHVVDLRSPSLADPVSSWTPTLRPIDDLGALPERKKITDVLVF